MILQAIGRVIVEVVLTVVLIAVVLGFLVLFIYSPGTGILLLIAWFIACAIYNDYAKKKRFKQQEKHYQYWANKDKYP